MCITDFLRTKAEGMGPSEQLTIDRGWIEWLLENHTCGCVGGSGSTAVPPPASLHGYAVDELARLFNRSASAIKSWCSSGVFGDPAKLKPNGRDWHVPKEKIDKLRGELARGCQITTEGLREPQSAKKGEKAQLKAPDAEDSGERATVTRVRAATRGRRSRERRHNGWREQFR